MSENKVMIWDICPEIDSYMADVEGNLEMDPDTWASYQADAYPFVLDVVHDFGQPGYTEEQIQAAVRAYVG